MPTLASATAHTLISRFVDHLPYYRQETINARSGVHTPRSTPAQWSGRGAQYPIAFFQAPREAQEGRAWQGTLVRDEYAAYDSTTMRSHDAQVPPGTGFPDRF